MGLLVRRRLRRCTTATVLRRRFATLRPALLRRRRFAIFVTLLFFVRFFVPGLPPSKPASPMLKTCPTFFRLARRRLTGLATDVLVVRLLLTRCPALVVRRLFLPLEALSAAFCLAVPKNLICLADIFRGLLARLRRLPELTRLLRFNTCAIS